jgi:uncharacterized repeat protein (TIGR03803 family)
LGQQRETRQTSPNSYRLLYSFKGVPDGANPVKHLLDVNGELYGVTSGGGAYDQRFSQPQQTGTVFKVSTSGSEKVLYTFQGEPDGAYSQAGLLYVKGEFYGTTFYGGTPKSRGTVFKVSPSGVESVLYRFRDFRDGKSPEGDLTDVNGELYGTTYWGGLTGCPGGCGTIYSVSMTGAHKVLYRFKGGTDGFAPTSKLLYIKGAFYGTTGGDYANNGTVFKMSQSGPERALYQFKGEPDGANPTAGLIYVNGEFYGTTDFGGSRLGGTLFKISPTGQESVVYSFSRGSTPIGGLLYVNGELYGTTFAGGGGSPGNGTVYKVSLAGKHTIVYAFKGGSDGKNPIGGLIRVNDDLYGTTSIGGANDLGTVFKVSL